MFETDRAGFSVEFFNRAFARVTGGFTRGANTQDRVLDLDRLDLAGFQPYLPSSLPVRLQAGTLDTELRIVFKELPVKVFSFAVVGRAHISGFDMNEATGAPLAIAKPTSAAASAGASLTPSGRLWRRKKRSS